MALETAKPDLTLESIVGQIDQIAELQRAAELFDGSASDAKSYLDYRVEEFDELLLRQRVIARAIDPLSGAITRHRRLMAPRRQERPTLSWYNSDLKHVPDYLNQTREQAEGIICGFDIDERAIVLNPEYFWRSSVRDWVRLVDPQGQPLVSLEFPEQQN